MTKAWQRFGEIERLVRSYREEHGLLSDDPVWLQADVGALAHEKPTQRELSDGHISWSMYGGALAGTGAIVCSKCSTTSRLSSSEGPLAVIEALQRFVERHQHAR